ncbi:MAG: hypothetical protein ACOYL6_04570 [Bacteriovoracaceae bacterium]
MRVLILLLLIWTLSFQVFCQELPAMVEEARIAILDLIDQTQKPIWQEGKAQVSSILVQNLSKQEKIKEAYKQYYSSRLSHLPDDMAEKLEKLEISISYDSTPQSMKAFYLEGNLMIDVKLHSTFKNTFLAQAIVVHELEHAIQDVSLSTRINSRYVSSPEDFLKTIAGDYYQLQREQDYLKETNAMMIEWHFLNAIPEDVKLKEWEKFKDLPDLPEKWKTLVKRMLIDSSSSREEYLKLQWEDGRYPAAKFDIENPHKLFRQGSVSNALCNLEFHSVKTIY